LDLHQLQRQPVRQPLAVFGKAVGDPGRRTLAHGDQARLQGVFPAWRRQRGRACIAPVSHPRRMRPTTTAANAPLQEACVPAFANPPPRPATQAPHRIECAPCAVPLPPCSCCACSPVPALPTPGTATATASPPTWPN